MNTNDITVSTHAVEKYLIIQNERGANAPTSYEDALNQLRELFSKAKLEPMTPGLVKRIIDNDFEPSEYYRLGKWRFVLCNNRMVTCEVDKFYKWSKHGKKRRRINK